MTTALTVLRKGLDEMGLDYGLAEPLGVYLQLLLEKNKVMDLTAITEPSDAVKLHLLDSLCLLPLLKGKNLIDVGTGGGLPGVPLAIARPDIHVTLLDSNGKRIAFLESVKKTMGLNNIQCVQARAEEFASQGRENFDVAVSRAVAALPVLCELCIPLVCKNGMFLAMKSVNSDDEIDSAKNAAKTLGCSPAVKCDYTVPTTNITHRTVIFEKVSSSPAKYPRMFAQIKKKPIL